MRCVGADVGFVGFHMGAICWLESIATGWVYRDTRCRRMDLDHLFICVDDAAAAERILTEFGLQFGLHAVHPGQGTANASAFFENAYLELLIRNDDEQLQS